MSVAAPLQAAPAKPQAALASAARGVLQRKCACGLSKSSSEGRDDEFPSPLLQRKLAIGASNDPLEREADRIANHVMRATDGLATPTPPIQVQGHTTSANALDEEPAPKSVEQTLSSAGQPLDLTPRMRMEQRFGRTFADVRVHADAIAAESAKAIGARAYTSGHHISFAAGEYQPGTTAGSRLLAHELTHVVQQSGTDRTSGRRGGGDGRSAVRKPHPGGGQANAALPSALVQRDLATPPPTKRPAPQPELTAAEIAAAIRFNRARYDAASTKLIQDIVGTQPTGKWIDDDIVAIATLQEEYGYTKDGKVGPSFFRFLDREVRLEKLKKTDKNCLLAFRVITHPAAVGPVAGGSRSITGQFEVRAQFSRHCGCADYEYRQFIRGHWIRERGGVRTDLGNTFTTIPGGGGLPTAFIEDGNTSSAALNYGHRAQPAEAINHYLDDTGAEDQANGCTFESEDTPGGADNVLPGDVFDIDVNFRGEIQRRGRAVRARQWSAIRGRFPVP